MFENESGCVMDEYNRSSLHYVCIDNAPDKRLKIAKELITSGQDVNAPDNDSWTPLHFAVQANCLEVVNLLIENGAYIEALEVNGNTPLWVATMNFNEDAQVITMLINVGADPDAKNIHGISPRDIEADLFNTET
ncbi:MAG: hypothetical protein GQ546_10130 [Gammaproteobacteria bacterium]|nr:hypothetical protein [Gammaproteobacteria bacterium]